MSTWIGTAVFDSSSVISPDFRRELLKALDQFSEDATGHGFSGSYTFFATFRFDAATQRKADMRIAEITNDLLKHIGNERLKVENYGSQPEAPDESDQKATHTYFIALQDGRQVAIRAHRFYLRSDHIYFFEDTTYNTVAQFPEREVTAVVRSDSILGKLTDAELPDTNEDA